MATAPSPVKDWRTRAIDQCQAALDMGQAVAGNHWPGSFQVAQIEASCMAAIRAVAPKGSPERERAEHVWGVYGGEGIEETVVGARDRRLSMVTLVLLGSVGALKHGLERGFLEQFESVVRAETFSDFLSMADYLHGEGYKDPAAVLAGGVLEDHLRQLCAKNSVAIVSGTDWKHSETMNQDLRKAGAYDLNIQKLVTGWLGIRNDAAHGKYSSYDAPMVRLMLDGIRQFMLRVPS